MSRLPLALVVLLLVLAACAPDRTGQATAAGQPEATAPAVLPPEPPPTWSEADSQVEVSLHIDTAVEAHPKLYAQLVEDGRDGRVAVGAAGIEPLAALKAEDAAGLDGLVVAGLHRPGRGRA